MQNRCIFRIKLMQKRCREEVKMTPKKEKHALRAVPQFTLQGSLQLTPVHSSFSSVSKAQSNQVQFRSVPIPFRSDHLSPITPAGLVLRVEPRTEPPRTVLGGVQQQTAVAPGFTRLGRHNIIVTHSTSYSQITSHSHTSHSALQQTPHNTK